MEPKKSLVAVLPGKKQCGSRRPCRQGRWPLLAREGAVRALILHLVAVEAGGRALALSIMIYSL